MSGYTTDLVVGLAEWLDAAGLGVWDPSAAVGSGQTAITLRVVPQRPDRVIVLSAYAVADDPGLADVTTGVQVRTRAGADPREVDDLADSVYDLLQGVHGVDLGGVPVVLISRQSYATLPPNAGGDAPDPRWERTDNYYVQAARPTSTRPV